MILDNSEISKRFKKLISQQDKTPKKEVSKSAIRTSNLRSVINKTRSRAKNLTKFKINIAHKVLILFIN
jgi:hypothetical protein